MSIPLNPSFSVWKWGLRGSKLYRRVSVMANAADVAMMVYRRLNERRRIQYWLKPWIMVVDECLSPSLSLSVEGDVVMACDFIFRELLTKRLGSARIDLFITLKWKAVVTRLKMICNWPPTSRRPICQCDSRWLTADKTFLGIPIVTSKAVSRFL